MKKWIRILAIIIFLVGVGFFAYPIVVRIAFDRQCYETIENFKELIREESSSENSSQNPEKENSHPIPYEKLYNAMKEYNEKLYRNKQSGLIDQLSYEVPDFKLSDYGVDSDVLGYITIPSIDVELPIYNGASEFNMSKGATYLANTSLPIGTPNSNCVIAAHTQYTGIYMFKRITELKTGDEVKITNFWGTLTYKVVETKIINPSDSQNIYIQEGRSLVTLSTCHPFPDNYQRYLVYAELQKT